MSSASFWGDHTWAGVVFALLALGAILAYLFEWRLSQEGWSVVARESNTFKNSDDNVIRGRLNSGATNLFNKSHRNTIEADVVHEPRFEADRQGDDSKSGDLKEHDGS